MSSPTAILARCFVITFIVILFSGCANSHHLSSAERRSAKISAQIGQAQQKAGIITSADYLHWEQIGNKIGSQKNLDDADLDWAISIMQKPSTDPADVNIMMMGLFMTAKTYTSEQREKIRNIVVPLRLSKNIREAKWATAVLKKVNVY